LPFFVVVLIATALIVMLSGWAQGAWTALLRALIAMVILQGGYAAGIVLRSLARSLRERRAAPGNVAQACAAQLSNEPKRR
jgi:hypothetical protein